MEDNILKYKVLFIVTAIISVLLFSTTVCAAQKEFYLSVEKNFIVVNAGDKSCKKAAKAVGMTERELRDYFEKNGVLLFAVTPDNSSQIRLSYYENDFSKLAQDISSLDEEGIGMLAKAIDKDETPEYDTVKNNSGEKFLKFTDFMKDSGGEYTVTQYVTVKNEKVYQLSCYTPGKTVPNSIEKTFKNFKITSYGKQNNASVLQTLLLILSIAVFLTLAVLMSVGIVSSLKKEKNKTA